MIVGASLAGAKAAETLREEGFEGRVVLVGAEEERPYERPPLSKDYLRGEVGREKVYVHDEGFYAEHDIELRLGRTAVSLDTASTRLELDDGEQLSYDRLLLATGAEPRRLSVPGAELDGVFYLRSVRDSDALRERLDRGGAVVVVGAGWIGAEVAASARQRGLDVTVDRARVGTAGARAGRRDRRHLPRHPHRSRRADADWAPASRRSRGTARSSVCAPTTGASSTATSSSSGSAFSRAPRWRPRPVWPSATAVLVDARLRASAPGVFAAGDVANAQHPFYGEPIRVEHWANALNQAPAAARSMLGQSALYDRLPYFFSDQYDVGMEYSGLARGCDRVVVRGDPAAREFVAFWMFEDRVMAGMNVNVWDVTDPIKQLIQRARRGRRPRTWPTWTCRSTSSPCASGGRAA